MPGAGAAAASFRNWISNTALPLWASVGFEPARGLFHERLDWSGAPQGALPRRAMVQARQIYVFSHAARLGWFAEGGRLAEIAMDSLLGAYCDGDGPRGGFAFSLKPDKTIASGVRDAYAHAFILFAMASLYRLNGDRRLLDHAAATAAFIDASLADARNGGLYDAAPVTDRTKRQNPHMHLLEAYLALESAAPGAGYLERARELALLFRTHLFVDDPGVLLEYFGEDWSDHPDPAKQGIFEPGHHFEWAWLLAEYQRLSGEDQFAAILQLYQSAKRRGLAGDGLIVDEVSRDMRVLKSSHRLWPHSEAVKAAVVLHERSDAGAPAFAAAMIGALAGVFLDRPFAGGWIDHFGEDGAPLVAAVPASSLYHLFFAAAEASRAFEPGGAR